MGTIICYINTIGIVPVHACHTCTLWLQVVQPLTKSHETKWTPHVKRESDIAQSYISSAKSLNKSGVTLHVCLAVSPSSGRCFACAHCSAKSHIGSPKISALLSL